MWIPRDRVTGIKAVRLATCTAVRFLSPTGDYDGILFYSFSPDRLLAALGAHAWPNADR